MQPKFEGLQYDVRHAPRGREEYGVQGMAMGVWEGRTVIC